MRTQKAALVNKANKKGSVKIVARAVSGAGVCNQQPSRKAESGSVGVVFRIEDMPDELYATCVVLAKKHGTNLEQEMVDLIAKGVGEEIYLARATKKRTRPPKKAMRIR